MRGILTSIEAEYRRYRALGEAAMAQLSPDQLHEPGPNASNSVAVIAWHVGGNLVSRFTDFLTTDGEKPWRNRDEEFVTRRPSREDLMAQWERGWDVLFAALAPLTDEDLGRTVTIRGVPLPVHAALHRSLAHTSYHVGQVVYVARALRGDRWEYLSIPPGGSRAYGENPARELGDAHASGLNPDAPE